MKDFSRQRVCVHRRDYCFVHVVHGIYGDNRSNKKSTHTAVFKNVYVVSHTRSRSMDNRCCYHVVLSVYALGI